MQFYGVFFVFASLTVIQSVHEVDAVGPGAIIGVISGVMGIYEFLKARHGELSSLSKADEIQKIADKESSKWNEQLNWNFRNIEGAIKDVERRQLLTKSMDTMKTSLELIHDNFNDIIKKRDSLKKRMNANQHFNERYYRSHAEKIIEDYAYASPLRAIYNTIGDSFKNYSVYKDSLIEQYEEHFNVCATHVSPLQAVVRLLQHIVWTSSYYHSTIMISHEILNILERKETDAQLADIHLTEISEWYNEAMSGIGPGLKRVSRELYACGLPDLSSHGSFYELNVSKKLFLKKCDGLEKDLKCSSITKANNCTGPVPESVCSLSRPCAGRMSDCGDSDNLDVCVSDSVDDRRYQYYHKPGVAGEFDDYGRCQTQNLKAQSLFAIDDYDYGTKYSCGYCQCTCMDEMYYFNPLPAYADIANNMVVTGAKFVMEINCLEIWIQQGKLLPNGKIEVPPAGAEALPWIRPQKKICLRISNEAYNRVVLNKKEVSSSGKLVIGLSLGPDSCYHCPIELDVHTASFDFRQGTVGHEDSTKPYDAYESMRKLNLSNHESPEKASNISREITQKDVQLKFTTSGGKDGGQSTIPFIDAREVTSAIPSPLSGAELYWRGREGTGGFIGISLYTYDDVASSEN